MGVRAGRISGGFRWHSQFGPDRAMISWLRECQCGEGGVWKSSRVTGALSSSVMLYAWEDLSSLGFGLCGGSAHLVPLNTVVHHGGGCTKINTCSPFLFYSSLVHLSCCTAVSISVSQHKTAEQGQFQWLVHVKSLKIWRQDQNGDYINLWLRLEWDLNF